MTLKEYLSQQGLTCEAFADKIGVKAPTAWRYANGHRIPRPTIMARIADATDGAVTAQDFYGGPGTEGGAA